MQSGEATRLEAWGRLDDLLADSRHNLPLVADPEATEEWRLLRPKAVSEMAAGRSGFAGGEVPTEGRLWVADEARGFLEAPIIATDGDHLVLKSRAGEVRVAKSAAEWVNPVELELCEDMANLVALSQASVLHNLRQRYRCNLIHTYSGMFCISINPWKRLPIYSPAVVRMYKGQEHGRMPPHVYAVADNTYNNILQGTENQSILITGESGAGKTENTKKIIFYFAQVAGRGVSESGVSLEEQIMQSNPVLESFGNAKTLLNDNSSRFGKFTRILFDDMGKVCGAEMESYLLEKSRVHSQSVLERSYHIFYQLCSSGMPELKAELGLDKAEASDYRFLCNGMNEVDTIDDAMDMEATDRGMSILGFSSEEKLQIYRITAGVLLLGELKFMQRSGGDQAYAHGIEEPKLVAAQLGINVHKLLDAITSPMIRVGETLVQQSRNLDQVHNSVSAVAKGLYERMFNWIIDRCNACLHSTRASTKSAGPKPELRFIGVLDIAGFEIFPLNSFEQICINYTNEKLQQFFNNRMFQKEQEEYASEGIEWQPVVDYASQLQPAIDLIEKPMSGLFSMLEEECFVPKGTEVSLLDKMHAAFIGADGNSAYGKPSHQRNETDSDFTVKHYAGKVHYSIAGWLEKNKDPLSEALVSVFADSANPILREIWAPLIAAFAANADRRGSLAALPTAKTAAGPNRRSSVVPTNKKGSFATVASTHKEQLGGLIAQLSQTQAYFIRCLVPNRERRAGNIDAQLILHQLRCNGVLEGIRIAQEGFPNRLMYEDVHTRYRVLDSEERDWLKAKTAAAGALLGHVGLRHKKDFQLGTTKVFFRSGILGQLEKARMEAIGAAIAGVQALVRARLQRNSMGALRKRSRAVALLQRNVRLFGQLRGWEWWRAYLLAKPMGSASLLQLRHDVEELEREREAYAKMLAEREAERLRLQKELGKLQTDVDQVLRDNKRTHDELAKSKEEKDQQELLVYKMHENLSQQDAGLNALKSELEEEQNRIRALQMTNQQLELNLGMLERSLVREKESREQMVLLGLTNNAALRHMEAQLADLQARNAGLQTDLSTKTLEAGQLSAKVGDREDIISRLREIIKRQQTHLFGLEAELDEERDERRRFETRARDLDIRLTDTTAERDRLQLDAAVQAETIDRLSSELGRSAESLEAEKAAHAAEVRDLRRQHAESVATLQDQVQVQSMTSLRLETERATLETVLEGRRQREEDESRFGSLPRSRLRRGNSTTQLALEAMRVQVEASSAVQAVSSFRKSSISSSPQTRRLEIFEKEAKVAAAEKAALSRELESLKRRLQEETSDRESAQRTAANQKAEWLGASEALGRSERQRADLDIEMRRLRTELHAKTAAVASQMLERDVGKEAEKKRLEESLRERSEALNSAQRRLVQAEAEIDKLQDDLRAKQGELRRAVSLLDPTPVLPNGHHFSPSASKLYQRQGSNTSSSSLYTNGF